MRVRSGSVPVSGPDEHDPGAQDRHDEYDEPAAQEPLQRAERISFYCHLSFQIRLPASSLVWHSRPRLCLYNIRGCRYPLAAST